MRGKLKEKKWLLMQSARRQILRGTILFSGALLSFVLMLGFSFLALIYLRSGAGIELFALTTSAPGVLVGALHLVGLLFGAAICFCMGVGLLAYALVPPDRKVRRCRQKPNFSSGSSVAACIELRNDVL